MWLLILLCDLDLTELLSRLNNRLRGRPRFGMIDDLKEGSYVKIKRRAEDKVAWRCWIPGPAWGQGTNDDDDINTNGNIVHVFVIRFLIVFYNVLGCIIWYHVTFCILFYTNNLNIEWIWWLVELRIDYNVIIKTYDQNFIAFFYYCLFYSNKTGPVFEYLHIFALTASCMRVE